jgi:hypothetical protein
MVKHIKRDIDPFSGRITDEHGKTVGWADPFSGRIEDRHGNIRGWYDIFSGKIEDKRGKTVGWHDIFSGRLEDRSGKNIGDYNALSGRYQDGEKGILEGDPCFVATAVYGNVNAPQVQTLRKFRDNVLMQSSIGKAFVNFYYSGAGKKTADFIREHLPSTVPAIRRGLDVLVDRYTAQKK